MLSRRGFATCVLCAATGFAATGAESAERARRAEAHHHRTHGRADGRLRNPSMSASISTRERCIPRHTHPGIEFELCR